LWPATCGWSRSAGSTGPSSELSGGLAGIPLVLFAALSGLAGGTAKASLGTALMFLILGACLYGLGHALERLLDEEAENET
jgi:hypothetical protein